MIESTRRVAPASSGAFTVLDGERSYRIAAYDRMPAFLLSLPSDSDLWMFVSSGGGLTAGRVDAEGSLFPYETVDRLHDGHHHTGPITLVRAAVGPGRTVVWQPFSDRSGEDFRIERNLYKNVLGNRLVFEEINHSLSLAFRYRWAACDEFGWVRTATLTNHGPAAVTLSLLDGLRNVLPYGVPLALSQQSSSLVDAYKRTERDAETGLGIFSLTARIVDRPEPAEELRANVAWCHGLPDPRVGLSLEAIAAFRRGDSPPHDELRTGRRGDYLVAASLTVEPGVPARWHVVADAGLDAVRLTALRARLLAGGDLERAIEDGLARASRNLLRNVASADGLQLTGHAESTAHHFASVLFNNMRGGVFARNHGIPREDFAAYLATRNRPAALRHAAWLAGQPATLPVRELLAAADSTGDADLQRLALEYLPLYFGRRHGDPSRPWNGFRIRVRNGDGSPALGYEGNWRDIFQNWEALGASFPGFLPGMIARFVNASTRDGFNPYRISNEGIDWEVLDPRHPWSGIGYWGDHQVVYLLRLLEALESHAPGEIARLLDREIFSYADVPYRLLPYDAIVEDPRSTIAFDHDLAARVEERVRTLGTDGKLVPGDEGSVAHVNLVEKLLVPALSKLSNLVPDGGIWMNTQRPEWNDANNALVGNGLSVVTVCHLRRYLIFLERLLSARADPDVALSGEVARWLERVLHVLEEHPSLLAAPTLHDRDRRHVMDGLGRAFSLYRESLDRNAPGERAQVPCADLVALCRVGVAWLDHTIDANRRADGLYGSYNLLALSEDRREAAVHPLGVMLEGQVAALSSGRVAPDEAAGILARLFDSDLYRADQRSFLLYPERALPGFLEKNVIPDARIRAVPLLSALLEAGERSLLERDARGVCRFNAGFANARDVEAALDRLAERGPWAAGVARDRQATLEVWEAVFHHRSFTGRSGTMYGYEGIGCIYWHMVAKLLLAVQELVLRAERESAAPAVLDALVRAYDRIRDGLGFAKTPEEFGAFPTDPYSHTPRHAGAQQPGMTGQVKEEILTRLGELGVQVEDGRVRFRPILLRPGELLRQAGTYRCFDVEGKAQAIAVPAGGLAFSYCQVPVIYESGEEETIGVTSRDGTTSRRPGDRLTPEESRAVFDRRGTVSRIDVRVRVPAPALRHQRR
jgi:hypothetical protein